MKMSRGRGVARTVLVATVSLLSIIGITSTAAAASGSASGKGVSATAQWDWVGTASISVYYRVVDDTACDNNDVYMYLRVYIWNANNAIANLRNSNGCNHGVGSLDTLRWDASSNIIKVRVYACVDDFGGNTCYYREFDNPNT